MANIEIYYCPGEAVQIKSKAYMKSYTQNNERYPHPYATASDIARQKHFEAGHGVGLIR